MIKTFRFALLACGLVGGALTATAAPAVPVRVATVELAPHAEERAIPGRVEAIRAVDIRARTEGVIVQRHFQDGQYVTEGDLLFTLDDAQPRAALALAQAELKSAEASLRQSQQLLTRYERLINNHSISRNDVDTARMQRDVAAAAVQQAKARVEAQQIVLSYTQIAAPVTGRVGHSAFHVGTLVNSSSGVLVDIVQLDPVRVSFALDEAAFFSKTGQHADIHALKQAWLAQIEVDGKRRDGVLTSIDNRIDARTGSVGAGRVRQSAAPSAAGRQRDDPVPSAGTAVASDGPGRRRAAGSAGLFQLGAEAGPHRRAASSDPRGAAGAAVCGRERAAGGRAGDHRRRAAVARRRRGAGAELAKEKGC